MTLLVICLHHHVSFCCTAPAGLWFPSSPHDLTTSSPTIEQDPALDNAHVVLGQISPGVRSDQIILWESVTFR